MNQNQSIKLGFLVDGAVNALSENVEGAEGFRSLFLDLASEAFELGLTEGIREAGILATQARMASETGAAHSGLPREALEVADRFLRRRATIGELRAAVKAARGIDDDPNPLNEPLAPMMSFDWEVPGDEPR